MTNATPLPPHDADAERALLGSLLINGDALLLVQDTVAAADFYRTEHGWIYAAMLVCLGRNEAVNEITVAYELAERDHLTDAGGLPYLTDLTLATPTSQHAEHYARLVAEKAAQRALIAAGAEIARIGYDTTGLTAEDRHAQAEDALTRARRDATGTTGFVHIRDVLGTVLQFPGSPLHDAAARDMQRIPTGFPALDSVLAGFVRGNLITIAARPGAGKTSLLLGIARNAAVQHQARVAIFSLEMAQEELVARLLSAEAGVDLQRLQQGYLNEAEQGRIWPAAGKLAGTELLFSDMAAVTETALRAKARRLHRQAPIDLLLVDYLGLMTSAGKGRGNRVEQVSEITRSLKALARELNVPVIAASQLNRQVEQRSPHRPQLSDLRDSGSVEQDSDIVIFIHREDKYITEEEWQRTYTNKPYPRGIATVLIAKHRNGPTGERELFFRENYARFDTLVWE